MISHKLFTVALFLTFFHGSVSGLKCYTCSCTEDDTDQSCADDVTKLGKNAITDCDKKYCTIVRIDYKDPQGKLKSISRSCADKLVVPDGVVEDESQRAYYRSCKEALCNSGSGKSEISGSTQSLGDKSTIYCPGIGSSSSSFSFVPILVYTFSFIIVLTQIIVRVC